MEKGKVVSINKGKAWEGKFGEMQSWFVTFEGDPTEWECSTKGADSQCRFVVGEIGNYRIQSSEANGGSFNKIKFESPEYAAKALIAPTYKNSGENNDRQKSIELQGCLKLSQNESNATGAGYAPELIKVNAAKYYALLQELKASV